MRSRRYTTSHPPIVNETWCFVRRSGGHRYRTRDSNPDHAVQSRASWPLEESGLNRRERFRLGARRVSNAGRTSPVPARRKPAGGFARTPEGAFAGGHGTAPSSEPQSRSPLFGCMFHDLPVGWSAKESNLQDIASPGLQPSCRPAAHTPFACFL